MVAFGRVSYLDEVLGGHELTRLFDALRRPKARGHVHCLPRGLKTDEVLHDGGVLVCGAALVEHDREIVRNLEEAPNLLFGHVGDVDELGLAVAQLHDGLTGAVVVDHLLGALVEDGAR